MKLQRNRMDLSILPVIFALAWPTMLEQLMQTAVQYIDTAMVGSLGTEATATVGATYTVTWLVNSSFFAIGIGFLAFISQAYGAENYDMTHRASAQAFLTVLVSGTIFTIIILGVSSHVPVWMQVDEDLQEMAARYFFILYIPTLPRAAIMILGTVLRAVGDTKTPMIVGVTVNIINIILNFILIYPTRSIGNFVIYGAGLGIDGAAIASASAFTVGGILITVALYRHPHVTPKGCSLMPELEILKPCMKVAFPALMQRFGVSMGQIVFASMINSVGQVATAAHTIANTVESLFYIPGHGVQTAAATLAGNALGARDEERLRELPKILILMEVIMMLVSGAALFIFAPAMCSIFSKSAEVILLGSIVLRMVAVSEPFYGVSVAVEGMMQGVGRTIRPFVYNTIGMWCVRIVGTFILTQIFDYGLVAAWGCMIAHNLLLFALYMVHYRSGRWNPMREEASA